MLRRQAETAEVAAPVAAEPQRQAATLLTTGAVNRSVLTATLQKPYSLYPLMLGLLGLAGAGLFSSVTAAVAGGIGVVVGLGGWIVDYFFRHDTLAGALLADYHAARRRQIAEQLETLDSALRDLDFPRGAVQLQELGEKFAGLKAVLDDKMNPGEITYGRYLGVAEQVYLNALDRLHDIASLMHGIDTIDPRYIADRLAALGWRDGMPAPAGSEAAALLERRRLAEEVTARVSDLVAANEAAMTALDATTVRLAGIRTRQGRAEMDMETAMDELTRLAQRATLYDIRQ